MRQNDTLSMIFIDCVPLQTFIRDFSQKAFNLKVLLHLKPFPIVSDVTTTTHKFSTTHGKSHYDHYYVEERPPNFMKTQRALFTVGYFQN